MRLNPFEPTIPLPDITGDRNRPERRIFPLSHSSLLDNAESGSAPMAPLPGAMPFGEGCHLGHEGARMGGL